MLLQSVQAEKRIDNRVTIPDGTAAVCAFDRCSRMKISHWETGKAEQQPGYMGIPVRKSEDLPGETPAHDCETRGGLLRKSAVTAFCCHGFLFMKKVPDYEEKAE